MKPWKTGLLILYCLGSLIALGNSFSHVWRTKKEVTASMKQPPILTDVNPKP